MPNDTIFTWIAALKDPKSSAVRDRVAKVADLPTNLLIYGETGVGKDTWVEYLRRTAGVEKILNLHCDDVPENLLESEWFGHKKGAFTGADHDYEGKWKQAEDGILFLNGIDLLSLNLQSKLLRIIENKKYFPLGSNREVPIHARFIFSTGSDILQRVRDGRFRDDLYYRISTYSIEVPPLRDRKQDILPLFHYFAERNGLKVNLGAEALKWLTNYFWRGNIRELENIVTSLAVTNREITDEDIFNLPQTSEDFLESVKTREMTMAELEKEYIYFLLRKYKNKSQVARILGIARKSLYNKLESFERRGISDKG